jgi:hypothetical protein
LAFRLSASNDPEKQEGLLSKSFLTDGETRTRPGGHHDLQTDASSRSDAERLQDERFERGWRLRRKAEVRGLVSPFEEMEHGSSPSWWALCEPTVDARFERVACDRPVACELPSD